jgi:FkbM family methyltransferase
VLVIIVVYLCQDLLTNIKALKPVIVAPRHNDLTINNQPNNNNRDTESYIADGSTSNHFVSNKSTTTESGRSVDSTSELNEIGGAAGINNQQDKMAKEALNGKADVIENIQPPYENWSRPVKIPNYIQTLNMEDPELWQYIARNWLLPPSSEPLKLEEPKRTHYSQVNQSMIVDELLYGRRNGFFIECGAANGELFSNSLFFEKSRNWTGVLVEAEPKAFDEMMAKHRHSFLLNACLSPTKKAMYIPFRVGGVLGALSGYMSDIHSERMDKAQGHRNETILVQCFPMYSILRAIGTTHVDFFSLDIEGAEVAVLRTLPLNQMTVDVFCVEHGSGQQNDIIEFLVGEHGYEIVNHTKFDIILKRKAT